MPLARSPPVEQARTLRSRLGHDERGRLAVVRGQAAAAQPLAALGLRLAARRRLRVLVSGHRLHLGNRFAGRLRLLRVVAVRRLARHLIRNREAIALLASGIPAILVSRAARSPRTELNATPLCSDATFLIKRRVRKERRRFLCFVRQSSKIITDLLKTRVTTVAMKKLLPQLMPAFRFAVEN